MTTIISKFTASSVHSLKIFLNVYYVPSDARPRSGVYRALESDELDPSPALIEFIMIGTCYGALRENQDFRLQNPVE